MEVLKKPLLFLLITICEISAQPSELCADNGILKVKFDLTRSGAIRCISLSGSERNLVNVYDEGIAKEIKII